MSLFSIINRAIQQNLRRSGITELSSHYIMPAALTPQGLVIDLGANAGAFYKQLLSKYDHECVAVEASPKLYENLPQRDGVSKFNYAIGKTDGNVSFFLSDNEEANSLNEAIAESWGVREQVTVEGITFENFLTRHHLSQKISLLKVDIEGAELDLLENVSSATLQRVSQIAIEFHDFLDQQADYVRRMHQTIRKLKKHGFLIIRVSNNDHREILCINTKNVKLSFYQRFRLQFLHRLLQYQKKTHSALAKHIKWS